MPRRPDQFDLIAITWIVCGVLDILIFAFQFLAMSWLVSDAKHAYLQIAFAIFILISIGSIASGVYVFTRRWDLLTIPGVISILWGVVHCSNSIGWMFLIVYSKFSPRLFVYVGIALILLMGVALIKSGWNAVTTGDEWHRARLRS
jgi:hypothetical protein